MRREVWSAVKTGMPDSESAIVTDTTPFAIIVLLTAAVGLIAVLSNRLTERMKIPSPVLVLVGAAVTVQVLPQLHPPSGIVVERVVTVALACILFDGGMHIGWSRFRSAALPIGVIGVMGTLLTAAAGAVLCHFAFGFGWYVSLLVATAVAPTDPAVVFSVLGQRKVQGLSGTILEGESGANDPVGIALMAGLIAAGGVGVQAFAHIAGEFVLQMGVGAIVGVLGGWTLVWFMRRVPLPSAGLYPLRTLASALVLFGVASLAHGSGFLAVFVAGIVVGDVRVPYKWEIKQFHGAIASLGEIAAFVVLGLTVSMREISRSEVWIPGLILGIFLVLVIRPTLVGLCLIPARLKANERKFVVFAGLKGAVPILLGSFLSSAHVAGAPRLYGIVVVVVVFSVAVNGSLVPAVARLLHLPMRTMEPEPWALAVRLRDEPGDVHRLTIGEGSLADGRAIVDLDELPSDAWVSLVVRDSHLVAVRGSTRLLAGDEILVLADPDLRQALADVFEKSQTS